jgi:hypothetical protein
VPAATYKPTNTVGIKIPKNAGYFSVRVNELFLKEGRSLWDTYDPMLIAVTEFLYDETRISVPVVISSELLKQRSNQTPHALLFNDVLIAGPHPFRGGNIALNLILYKVKRDNFAKSTVRFVEGVSSAIGIPADVAFLTKVGSAFVDGLEALIDLADTVPLFGNRIEIDTSKISGLTSSCWLLTPTGGLPFGDLNVENGRLLIGQENSRRKFDSQDYVLYSLLGCSRRANESSLPFYPLRQLALDSIPSGEEGWKRAKALLLTLYQQMITSPDLTSDEAEELFEKYKSELLNARDTLLKTTALSPSRKQPSAKTTRLNDATKVLDLSATSERRCLNAWTNEHSPKVNRPFELKLNIGAPRPNSLVTARFDTPFNNSKTVKLLVSVASLHCDIQPSWRELHLPPSGDSNVVVFTIAADKVGQHNFSIRIYLAEQMIPLQSLGFAIDIKSAEMPKVRAL